MLPVVRSAVPSLVTATSFVLGFAAVIWAALGALELAGWLIVWCVLLDVVDGALARWLNATSRFGAEFDSLADLVAFGVAPAVLAFHVVSPLVAVPQADAKFWFLVFGAGAYALCDAVRLARFNAMSEATGHGWFAGLPTTLAGLIVATSLILLARGGAETAQAWAGYVSVLLLAAAAAMVSTVRIPAIRRRRNRWLDAMQWAIVAAGYACGILRIAPAYILAFGVAYLVTGVAAGLIAGRGAAGQSRG